MSQMSVLSDEEYSPRIRNNIELGDLSLKTDAGPFAATMFDKAHPEKVGKLSKPDLIDVANRTGIVGYSPPKLYITTERPRRRKLVDVEEFRESLLFLAQHSPCLAKARSADGTPLRVNARLSASPLMDALVQAAERKRAVTEMATKLGSPPLTSIPVTPLKVGPECATDATALSSAGVDKGNDREFEKSPNTGDPIRPLLVGPSPRNTARSSQSEDPSINVALRLVRIVERAAARRILRAWRRRRKATEKYREEISKMKTFMKEVVVSALKANRQIRDELRGIRDQMLKTAVAKLPPPVIYTPKSEIFQSPDEKEIVRPNKPLEFRSARVLLDSAVKSPKMIDFLLTDLTLGADRTCVRLCIGQPTLHVKAFVVVILLETLSPEEWLARIVKSTHVFAYDRAFPLSQLTKAGVPWEVRIRKDMSTIIPDWVESGGQNQIHNSLS